MVRIFKYINFLPQFLDALFLFWWKFLSLSVSGQAVLWNGWFGVSLWALWILELVTFPLYWEATNEMRMSVNHTRWHGMGEFLVQKENVTVNIFTSASLIPGREICKSFCTNSVNRVIGIDWENFSGRKIHILPKTLICNCLNKKGKVCFSPITPRGMSSMVSVL